METNLELSLRELEMIDAQELSSRIKIEIESIRRQSRDAVNDIIRIIKAKSALGLAGPNKGSTQGYDSLEMLIVDEVHQLNADNSSMCHEMTKEVLLCCDPIKTANIIDNAPKRITTTEGL
jgi:hypothetical protein